MTLIQAVQGVFTSPALGAAAWGMAASFALCVLLVLTKRWHGALTMDQMDGIQKFHTSPTPRIGGVPIVIGLIVTWGKSPDEFKHPITPILIAGCVPSSLGCWKTSPNELVSSSVCSQP